MLPSKSSVIVDLHFHMEDLLWNLCFELDLLFIASKLFSNVFTALAKNTWS